MAYVLSRAIAAPIHGLIGRTKEISMGGRTAIQPLQSYGTHEIATLSQSFLDLAGQLVDRTDYVRSFAAHVSHELKSPLTAIKGAAELLRDEDGDLPMTKQQRDRFLSNIVAEADRLDRLLLRLRELAHAELPPTKGQTTMAEVVADLAPRFQGIEIVSLGDIQQTLALPLEAAAISVGNLVENALQHGARLKTPHPPLRWDHRAGVINPTVGK